MILYSGGRSPDSAPFVSAFSSYHRKARVFSDYSLTNLYNFVVRFSFSLSVGGIRQNLQRVFVYFLQYKERSLSLRQDFFG